MAWHAGSMARGLAGFVSLPGMASHHGAVSTHGSGRKRGASRARSEPKASGVNRASQRDCHAATPPSPDSRRLVQPRSATTT